MSHSSHAWAECPRALSAYGGGSGGEGSSRSHERLALDVRPEPVAAEEKQFTLAMSSCIYLDVLHGTEGPAACQHGACGFVSAERDTGAKRVWRSAQGPARGGLAQVDSSSPERNHQR